MFDTLNIFESSKYNTEIQQKKAAKASKMDLMEVSLEI